MKKLCLLLALGCGFLPWGWRAPAQEAPPDRLAQARTLYENEDFLKGLEFCRSTVVDPAWDGQDAGQWTSLLVKMMYDIDPARRTGFADYDAVLEKMVETHPENWRVLAAVAGQYQDYRWSWGAVSKNNLLVRCQMQLSGGIKATGLVWPHDRARGLQLFEKAVRLMEADAGAPPAGKSRVYLAYAKCLVAGQAEAVKEMEKVPGNNRGGSYSQVLPADLATFKPPANVPAPSLWDTRFAGGKTASGPPVPPPSWPLDAAGKLSFPAIPAAFGEARDDVMRWRWLVAHAVALDPACEVEALKIRVQFSDPLFGMKSLPAVYREFVVSLSPESAAGKAWHPGGLADDEALVWCNGTMQRTRLPADLNPVAGCQRLAALGDQEGHLKWCEALEARCQFGQAAAAWRQLVARHGPGKDGLWQKKLDFFIRPAYSFRFPRFLTPADTCFPVVARNARKLQFSARRLDVDKALARVRAAPPAADGMLSRPDCLSAEWLALPGRQAADRPPVPWDELLQPPVVWEEALAAGPELADATHLVKPPFHEPGAWFLEMKAEGSEPVRGVVCVADVVQLAFAGLQDEKIGSPAALLPDQCPGADLRYYADPVTGKLRAGADWQTLIYLSKQKRENNATRFEQKQLECPVKSDATGQIPLSGLPLEPVFADPSTSCCLYLLPRQADGSLSLWMPVVAFSAKLLQNRYGLIGIPSHERLRQASVSFSMMEPNEFWDRRPVVWGVLSRPVYAAGDTVRGRIWAQARTIPGKAPAAVAAQEIPLWLFPWGNWGGKIRLGSVRIDDPAGFLVEYKLPANAAPSAYIISAGDEPPPQVDARFPRTPGPFLCFSVGAVPAPVRSLRLDAPSIIAPGAGLPISLAGRDAQGRPLAGAKVNLRVYGRDWQDPQTPESLWTPLCGAAASWLAPDADHFPDWKEWGWPAEPSASQECLLASSGRFQHSGSTAQDPDKNELPWRNQELLFSRTIELDKQGQAACLVDTSFFNAFRDGRRLQFSVMAEVVSSGSGSGSANSRVAEQRVCSAARPAVLRLAASRGFQRPGTAFQTTVQAYRLDGTPVSGPVGIKIQRIAAGPDNQPVFTTRETRQLILDADGKGVLSLQLDQPGQYRLLGDILCDRQPVVGGTLVLVKGEADTLDDACFKPLELVVEKGVAGAGDTLRLLVNSCYADATVLLFVRAEEGFVPVPRIIRMAGRSHEELIEIRKEDAHQVFVHAEMLRNGQRFQAIREIPVQPLERWLAVTPKTEIDAAGQVARTLIRVADAAGNPVANAPVSINSWNQSLESRFWPWVFSQRLNQKMAWKPCLRHWAASTNSMLKPPCLGSSGPDCGLDRLALPPASRGAFVRLVDGIMPRPGVDAAERQGIGSYYLFRFNSGSEAPLLPEDFPVWKTGLATDAEGKVMVEWPLPQKPGTWRLRVSCQAAGRRFGDAEETFRLPGNPPAAAAGGK